MGFPQVKLSELARRALVASFEAKVSPRLAQELAEKYTNHALQETIRPFVPQEPDATNTSPFTSYAYFVPSQDGPNPVIQKKALIAASKEAIEQQNREFWSIVFKESRITLAELEPARIRVVWRIFRHLASCLQLLTENQPLGELNGDLWTKTTRIPAPHGKIENKSLWLALTDSYFSLLPTQETNLDHYCATLALTAEALKIPYGTQDEPYLGRYGLKGLLEPALVQAAIPDPEKLIQWEHKLIDETYQVLVARGTNGAYEWLHNKHGLLKHECRPLITSANAEALLRTSGELEEKRARMILKLEDCARRARRSLRPAVELNALKLQALVEGLARVEPDNIMSEFVATVRKVADEDLKEIITVDADTKQLTADKDPEITIQ